MLSKFFLDRPVFAWVIAIIMMLAGGLAIYNLPVSQYPPIAPPSIAISAFYPGASAETLAKTVAGPIEEQLSGVENLLYFNSTSASNGTISITGIFSLAATLSAGETLPRSTIRALALRSER